jgi:hypothetical protein
LSASINQSETDFIDSSARSDALSYIVYLSGSPKGPWAYSIGLNGLATGGSGDFQQDGIGVDANLSYRLDPKQALRFLFHKGRTVGYLGQDEFLASIAYEYSIFRNVALVGSYKVREVRNLDPKATSGAYKSSGFDLELVFRFYP